MTNLNPETQNQIDQCILLLKEVFKQDLLGFYLYGSAIMGGLQKYSDIDLLVVSQRSTTKEEKKQIIESLLKISGQYMKETKFPIELTIIVQSAINPWKYPPSFDFQYGEWLRENFENGEVEPWSTKVMPDLALLISQILLISKTLLGFSADHLMCK